MLFGDHFDINYVIWPPYEDIKPLAHLSSTHVDGSDATRMISSEVWAVVVYVIPTRPTRVEN